MERTRIWERKPEISKFYGVVFAFRSESDARKFAKQMRKANLSPNVVQAFRDGELYYIRELD